MDDNALGKTPPAANEEHSPEQANAARLCRLALRNQDTDGAFLTLLGALAELVRDEHGLAARGAGRERCERIAVLLDEIEREIAGGIDPAVH